jgi:hypothetical protein
VRGFDRFGAERARDVSMDQVEAAASLVWQEAAWRAITYIATVRKEFTTDAVWFVLEKWKVEGPREPRAMGPMMRRALNAKLCLATGRFGCSVRVACHRRPITIYESLLFSEPLP